MKTELSRFDSEIINNDYYHGLAEKWYTAQDDPIALLRAESQLRNQWVFDEVQKRFSKPTILDMACGGGFLSNFMAKKGLQVTGVDLSAESLTIARKMDETKTAIYIEADAYALPFADQSFDVVTAMDFLEHVSDPKKVLQEVARVLKPGGIFFFHTFNKNILSYLLVIKGVEWFVKNTPKHMHVYSLFIKPKDLKNWMKNQGLNIEILRGLQPNFTSKSFWKMLWTREVPKDFEFRWSNSTLISYTGMASKAHYLI